MLLVTESVAEMVFVSGGGFALTIKYFCHLSHVISSVRSVFFRGKNFVSLNFWRVFMTAITAYRAAILHSLGDPAQVGLEESYAYYEDGILVVNEGPPSRCWPA